MGQLTFQIIISGKLHTQVDIAVVSDSKHEASVFPTTVTEQFAF